MGDEYLLKPGHARLDAPRPRLLDRHGRPIAGGPISRRAFVKTSGGIFVAAGLGGACSGDGWAPPTPTGSLRAVVSGLDPSAASGGQVTVTALDVAGFTPITVTLPASGDSGTVPDIPVGNYRLAYTPPSDHALGVGEVNPKDTAVTANAQTTVTWAVTVAQSTIRVTVTGLAANAASGGSASILRIDISGQSPVILSIPPGGTADLGVTIGAYSVLYTPPSGYNVNSGVPNPQNLAAISGPVVVATFAVTESGGGFATPDIVNNASFETDFDGFTDWGSGTPSGVSRDTAQAFAGSFAVKKALPVTSGTDIGSQFVYRTPASDRLWGRFYFYLDAVIDGIVKFQLWFDSGFNTQFGGFGLFQNTINFAFGAEGFIGCKLINLSSAINAWHSLEVDYWRNGDPSGFPSAAIWYDGVQLTSGVATPNSPVSWIDGRLNAGKRSSSNKLGIYEVLGLLNGSPANTIPGNVWVDKVALSSVGRIGP